MAGRGAPLFSVVLACIVHDATVVHSSLEETHAHAHAHEVLIRRHTYVYRASEALTELRTVWYHSTGTAIYHACGSLIIESTGSLIFKFS